MQQQPHGGVDGLVELEKRFPEAFAVLGRLKHPGGELATNATLRVRFLYVNGEGMPDDSVKGLPLERRVELVAAALIEGQGAGWDKFNARAMAGFVRPLRDPRPASAPTRTAEVPHSAEPVSEEARAVTQAMRERERRATLELDKGAQAERAAEDEARAWLDAADPETQARATLRVKRRFEELGRAVPEKRDHWMLRKVVREVANELRNAEPGQAA